MTQPLDSAISELRSETERELTKKYSPLIGGRELRQLLGFPSDAAFRQAASRNTLPVPTVILAGRRGRFARARDVAAYLDTLEAAFDAAALEPTSKTEASPRCTKSAAAELADPTRRPP